jgi:hypothetical protein
MPGRGYWVSRLPGSGKLTRLRHGYNVLSMANTASATGNSRHLASEITPGMVVKTQYLNDVDMTPGTWRTVASVGPRPVHRQGGTEVTFTDGTAVHLAKLAKVTVRAS